MEWAEIRTSEYQNIRGPEKREGGNYENKKRENLK